MKYMKYTRAKEIGLFFTLVFLLLSFLFSGLLRNVKIVSAETKEENTFEDMNYVPDDYSAGASLKPMETGIGVKAVDLANDMSSSVHVVTSSQDIIRSIISSETFSIKGTITVDSRTLDLNDYFDFSSLSKFDIANWAYNENLISEEEKIESYCDLILSRNFKNIYCLSSVVYEIQNYFDYAEIAIAQKIESALAIPFEDKHTELSTANISNQKRYQSTNFAIHYDGNRSNEHVAKEVADYFEEVRSKYLNFGFKEPLREAFRSRYHVYLDPDLNSDNSGFAAVTTGNIGLSNTCSTHITIYNFTLLNDDVCDIIAHEYFHAIQAAYNCNQDWFLEACASWSSIMICDDYPVTREFINSFIDKNYYNISLSTYYGARAVFFPLTLYNKYGGVSVIRSIYEEYNRHSRNIDLDELRTVITNGIINNGYPLGSFEETYLNMATNIVNPAHWFKNISDAKNWHKVVPNIWYITSSTSFSYGYIDYLTTQYYSVRIPSGYSGNLKLELNCISGDCEVQTYIVDKNDDPIFTPNRKATNGRYYTEVPYVDGNITEVYFIISNTSSSGTARYSYSCSLSLYDKDIDFTNYDRYVERLCYIPQGEYAEYNVTFNTVDAFNIIFQTFGEYDTILELYSQSGALLASNDDGGYSLNSLIQYTVSSKTTYKVRVKFYNSAKYGITKLAIIPASGNLSTGATSINQYENIYALSSANYTWDSYAERNYVRVLRFIPPSSGTYTFVLNSDFDNFIYVIDPRYAEAIIEDEDYNDNCGSYDQWEGEWSDYNAKLTKKLSANVPYLIIYSGAVPASHYGNLTLKISRQS